MLNMCSKNTSLENIKNIHIKNDSRIQNRVTISIVEINLTRMQSTTYSNVKGRKELSCVLSPIVLGRAHSIPVSTVTSVTGLHHLFLYNKFITFCAGVVL